MLRIQQRRLLLTGYLLLCADWSRLCRVAHLRRGWGLYFLLLGRLPGGPRIHGRPVLIAVRHLGRVRTVFPRLSGDAVRALARRHELPLRLGRLHPHNLHIETAIRAVFASQL